MAIPAEVFNWQSFQSLTCRRVNNRTFTVTVVIASNKDQLVTLSVDREQTKVKKTPTKRLVK